MRKPRAAAKVASEGHRSGGISRLALVNRRGRSLPARRQAGPDEGKELFADAWDPRAIGQVYGTSASDWPFALADLRAYDRELTDKEIAELSQ